MCDSQGGNPKLPLTSLDLSAVVIWNRNPTRLSKLSTNFSQHSFSLVEHGIIVIWLYGAQEWEVSGLTVGYIDTCAVHTIVYNEESSAVTAAPLIIMFYYEFKLIAANRRPYLPLFIHSCLYHWIRASLPPKCWAILRLVYLASFNRIEWPISN